MQIIEALKAAGLLITLEGKNIRVKPKDPRAKIALSTIELLIKELKANKLAVTQYLCDKVENMTLQDFSRANLAVKIHSEVLGKEVYFVSNEKMRGQVKDEGLVTYLPHELEHIIRIKPGTRELRTIHLVKETFPESQMVERIEELKGREEANRF